MSRPEMKARPGTGAPDGPAGDVKTALMGVLHEITDRLHKQEERLTMLDRKSTALRRPALAAAAEDEAPHRKAFGTYLRNGDEAPLRGIELEGKALATTTPADGGYLVDPQTAETIRSVLKSTASIRQIANVVTVEATSYDVLIDHTDLGVGWADETTDTAVTDTPKIDRISIPLHELSALPKASQRLLDDSAFDIEEWLAGRIADRFARAEAKAFIDGDGLDKPTGFLTHPKVAEASWTWENLGFVLSGADGGFDPVTPADPIVDLVYALGAQYRANAQFVMNSKTAGLVRKIKDGEGRFVWSDGLAAGEPARLMGYPVLVAEEMPDAEVGQYAIAFGDFTAGYTVAERPDLRILRDPFSAKPHVLFYATKRVGGDVSDFAAIKLMKFSAI